MLVLSRRSGECVQIGDSVEVTVLEVRNGRVKLGLAGPADVSFQRSELLEQAEPGMKRRFSGASA